MTARNTPSAQAGFATYCDGVDEIARENSMTSETNLEPVFAFLLGEGPLDGVWFGDRSNHPTEKGAFWWRKHLRAALSPSHPSPETKP